MTTVRWLREYRPGLWMGGSDGAREQLSKALARLEYPIEGSITDVLDNWGEASHRALADWLAEQDKKSAMAAKLEAVKSAMTAVGIDIDELLEIEPDESTTPEEAAAAKAERVTVAQNHRRTGKATAAGRSPERALHDEVGGPIIEQSLDDVASVAGNDFAGSW